MWFRVPLLPTTEASGIPRSVLQIKTPSVFDWPAGVYGTKVRLGRREYVGTLYWNRGSGKTGSLALHAAELHLDDRQRFVEFHMGEFTRALEAGDPGFDSNQKIT